MLGDYVTWVLGLLLAYAYPAYECFRAIEQNRPEMEQLRFWCQYWIIIGLLTVLERVGDMFISWLPLYNEAKLAFIIYLWHPKTKGTWYIYNAFFMPLLAQHEPGINRKLNEIRAKSLDLLYFYIKNFAEKGQSLFFDLLSYFVKEASGPPPSQGSAAHRPPDPPPPSAPPVVPPNNSARNRRHGGRNSWPEPEHEEDRRRHHPPSGGSTDLGRLLREGPFDFLKNNHLQQRD